jgi:hypothetical protein
MDKIKLILIVVAVIIGGLGVLAAIGLVYSLMNYIIVFGVIALGVYIAVKLGAKPEPKEIKPPDSRKELKNIQRLLDQYKKDQ